MDDIGLVGEAGRKELVKILDSYWENQNGTRGLTTINPDSIKHRLSRDHYVMVEYAGKDVYLFRGRESSHIDALMVLSQRLKAEGFKFLRGMNENRVYLVVENSD